MCVLYSVSMCVVCVTVGACVCVRQPVHFEELWYVYVFYTSVSFIKVQMRYDGTVGFPGATADRGETPEMAVNRELSEGLEHDVDKVTVTPADYLLVSKISHEHRKTFCLHYHAKEISLETLQQLEKSILTQNKYGQEVTVTLDNT